MYRLGILSRHMLTALLEQTALCATVCPATSFLRPLLRRCVLRVVRSFPFMIRPSSTARPSILPACLPIDAGDVRAAALLSHNPQFGKTGPAGMQDLPLQGGFAISGFG